MVISCTSKYNIYLCSPFLLFLFIFYGVGAAVTVTAAEKTSTAKISMNIPELIEQLHEEIEMQVTLNKLPEERLSQAEMLKRLYDEGKYDHSSQLNKLIIDVLGASNDKAKALQQLINNVRRDEQITYEYLIRLLLLRSPTAEFDQVSIMHLPYSTNADKEDKNENSGSNFSIKWQPDDVISGDSE